LLISVSTQDPAVTTAFHVPEYRDSKMLQLDSRSGKVNLTQISIEKNDCNVSKLMLEENTFYLRFRYRIQRFLWKKDHQYLKGIVYDEIMINGGNKIIKIHFDQNRNCITADELD
jgi:hypothetical protein